MNTGNGYNWSKATPMKSITSGDVIDRFLLS